MCRTIKKVEEVLIKSKQFHLPGKKALDPSDIVIEIVLVDATEQPIERPSKDTAGIIAAKRSGTPPKAQLIANLNTAQILATDFSNGREHDFQLFQRSRCTLSRQTCVLADSDHSP